MNDDPSCAAWTALITNSERMKVMLKTGILKVRPSRACDVKLTGNTKDNADLTKLGPGAVS